MNKKNEDSDAFSEVAYRHDDPIASLDCVCSQVFYMCYNAVSKNPHLQIVPQ